MACLTDLIGCVDAWTADQVRMTKGRLHMNLRMM